MTSRSRAEFVLLGVTLAWGGSFLVVKNTLATLPPLSLVALRFALAAAVLALAFRGKAFALGQGASGRSHWRTAAGIGALLWAAFAFQTAGLVYTTPARSGFITATYVAFVPLLARVVLGRRLRKRVLVAVGAALAGLILLTDARGGGANFGDALTLLGALAFAAHILALDRFASAMPSSALAFVQMAVVAGLSLPLALAFESTPHALDLPGIAAIAYLGVICSAVGFLGQTWGQRHTTPIRVGLIFSLESLFAALLSVAIGAEVLTPWQWLGGLMLVGGVVIGELPEDAAPAPARAN